MPQVKVIIGFEKQQGLDKDWLLDNLSAALHTCFAMNHSDVDNLYFEIEEVLDE